MSPSTHPRLRTHLRVDCQQTPSPRAQATHGRPRTNHKPLLVPVSTAHWKWVAGFALVALLLSTCLPDSASSISTALASPVPNPNPNPFAFPLPVPVPAPIAQAQQPPPPAAPAPPRPPAPPAQQPPAAPRPPAQQPPPAAPRPPAQQQPPAGQRPPAAPGTQPAPPARNGAAPAPGQPARPAQPTRAAAPRATGTVRPTASARASVARPTQRKTIIQTKLGPLAKEDIDAAVNDPSKFSFTKPVIVGMAVGGGFMVVLLFVLGAAMTRSSRR